MSSLLKVNSTQVPNILLDKFMHRLKDAEFKCLMYICRRTYGFQKRQDWISLSQFESGLTDRDGKRLDGGTGKSRPAVVSALARLVESGLLKRERKGRGVAYAIDLECDLEDVVKKLNQSSKLKNLTETSKKTLPKVVKKFNTQKKGNKGNIKHTKGEPFVWSKYLMEMDNDKRKAVQLIAYYFKYRGKSFDSLEEAQEAIRRHVRHANKVVKFSEDKVVAAFGTCNTKHRDVDWTLETVYKVLTK